MPLKLRNAQPRTRGLVKVPDCASSRVAAESQRSNTTPSKVKSDEGERKVVAATGPLSVAPLPMIVSGALGVSAVQLESR